VTVASDGVGAGKLDGGADKRAAPESGVWAAAWRLQRPEAPVLASAFSLAAVNGVALPAFAILVERFVNVFYLDTGAMIAQAAVYLGIFFGLAIASAFNAHDAAPAAAPAAATLATLTTNPSRVSRP
jgi:hypothetical protein